MTNRQVRLITELVAACWAHDQQLGAKILIDLLGDRVDEEVSSKVKEMMANGGRSGDD